MQFLLYQGVSVVYDSSIQRFVFLLRLVEFLLVLDLQLMLFVDYHVENVEILLVKPVNGRLSFFLELLLLLLKNCYFLLVMDSGFFCLRAPHSYNTVHILVLPILGLLKLSTAA